MNKDESIINDKDYSRDEFLTLGHLEIRYFSKMIDGKIILGHLSKLESTLKNNNHLNKRQKKKLLDEANNFKEIIEKDLNIGENHGY